ncbi:CU044_5270 family protein [Streptomyces sp. NPDC001401]|uniref:CU044_5270 family protein n=1 Tax=Streptomyces sp. NPDC001401 TaxID=3364570 RepID=UPI00367A8886
MDDLTAVRELEADVPPLTDDARSAARVRLQHAIVQEGRSGALSRRLMLRVAVAGTAAAAVAGGVVVAARRDGDTGAPRMTTLNAAQLLHKAADRSRADSADTPIPRNDQYLYTKTYITRTYVKDGRVKTWTDESWMSVDGSKPSRREEFGKVHNDPPLTKHEVRWPPTEYAKLAKWPTDPDKLLKWLRMEQKSTPQADMQAFMNACMLMQGPRVMPPGLEAATFEAVAKLPDIRLDYHEVDALGRRGIALSYPETSFTFVFDPKTYAYLGLRLKGSSAKKVHGEWRQVAWYHEMRGLEELGVVDRIGQRP